MRQITLEQKRKMRELIIQKMVEVDSLNQGMINLVAERSKEYDKLRESVDEALKLKEVIAKAINDAYDIIDNYRPADGYTPVKGEDYYTDDEKEEIVEKAVEMVLERAELPDADEVSDYLIGKIKLPDPIPGEPGKTPTKKELKKLIKEVIEEVLPKINEKALKAEISLALKSEMDVREMSILDEIRNGKKIKSEDIEGLAQTLEAMWSQIGNRGYLHGGGDTVKAGTNITLTRNPDGTTTISATGGSGFNLLEFTGTVDDSNTIFTTTSEPSLVVINGAMYRSTGGPITWSYLAGTVTLSSPVGTGGNIYGIGS